MSICKHEGHKFDLRECTSDDHYTMRQWREQGYTLARSYYDNERNVRIMVFERCSK